LIDQVALESNSKSGLARVSFFRNEKVAFTSVFPDFGGISWYRKQHCKDKSLERN
jgi:hypothetical protein